MSINKDLAKGISKNILYGGIGPEVEFVDGTKVFFYYRASKILENGEKVVLDDIKKTGKPFELLFGKQFKLDIWEFCLKSMRKQEVASFVCQPWTVSMYPPVAKQLRDYFAGKTESARHCCGMAQMQQNHGLGYADLDELVQNPCPIEFILELVEINHPGDYKADLWALTEKEREVEAMKLHEEGNSFYKAKKYIEASNSYSSAIGLLEDMLLREKPGTEEHDELLNRKHTLLLNFSQCKLSLKEWYTVIEHTTTVLEKDVHNVKALFRRAKARMQVWDFDLARDDLDRALTQDSSLEKIVKAELTIIDKMETVKNREDKTRYKGLF